MKLYRYSAWDGSQEWSDPDADDLLNELSKRLMSHGDVARALRDMQRENLLNCNGKQMPSLSDLRQRLRQMRQAQLEKYNLGSAIDDVRQKLDNIVQMERDGIQQQLDEMRGKAQAESNQLNLPLAQKLMQKTEQRAASNLNKLDNLPSSVGGKIKELTQYDFMDSEAQRQFQELLDQLKKNAVQSYARDLMNNIMNMDSQSMSGVRNLVEAINQMLESRMRGEQPDFEGFMQQFGDSFGPNPPQNFDELMERLREQIAQARSLLESMSPEDRRELMEALQSVLNEGTQYELAKMVVNLQSLFPDDNLEQDYPFSGEESISYTEALKLMEELQKMDRLEEQLQRTEFDPSDDVIDEDLLRELMGDDAAKELESLRRIAQVLEEAGYIRRKGDRYELTPRGIRKIGQKALETLFSNLKKDRSGAHAMVQTGNGTERTEETRKYEPGDDFHIHLQKTVTNSLFRRAGPPPLHLTPDDFEVLQTEASTRSAIALLVDLSISMSMRGYFDAAKMVALALDALIRSKYPKDSLYLIGFSHRAREIKKDDLVYLTCNSLDHGTNLQHALSLAARLLDKQNCANKEVLLVTDGEPTAHYEHGEIYFQYPPSMRTLQLTLREVKNCTKKGITINTFMFESSAFLASFVTQIARINRGRVFFTSADNLGEYLLTDFISKKHRKVE